MDSNNYGTKYNNTKNKLKYDEDYDGYGKKRFNFDFKTPIVSPIIWIVLLIILAVPYVNILVMLIILLRSENKNLQNFSVAALIFILAKLGFKYILRGL